MKRTGVVLPAIAGCLLGLCVLAFANLHDPNNAADYLIITTGHLIETYPWINDLADWRGTTDGRTAMVVATDSIWSEFGSPSDSVLKDFLFYAYRNWRAPQLRDVFIIGWHDVVPSHVQPDSNYTTDSTGHPYYRPYNYLSDFYYTTDPDEANDLPLLNIGRLPWSPADTIPFFDYYAKVAAYESASSDEPFLRRVHLIADYTDNQFNFWQNFAEPIAVQVRAGYEIERDYPSAPDDSPWHSDRDDIIADLNAGSYLAMYVGHGGAGVWSARLMLTAQTFDSLTNGHRLPIVCGNSYDAGTNGNWTLGANATAFLSNPHGGAIGYFGQSNVAWALAGLDYRKLIAHFTTSDSVTVLGDIWRLALQSFVERNRTNFRSAPQLRQTGLGSMLFGDPGLKLPQRPDRVTEKTAPVPGRAQLVGNFPNPFNARTELRFELTQPLPIRLRIINTLGQEVARLADGMYGAGVHTAQWNASACGSGIYFAAFDAGNVHQVRKMMLLK